MPKLLSASRHMKTEIPHIMTVQGRLVNKRALSKRLVFYQLERDTGDLELVLKPCYPGASGLLDADQVRCLKDTLRLGDIVSVQGVLERNKTTFRVHSITVTEDWKKHHAGISFVPKSLPTLQVQHKQSSPIYSGHPNSGSSNVGQDDNALQALCKQWINGGRCTKGDACQYRHVQPSELPELRKGWVAARKKQQQAAACEAGNPHTQNAAKKRQRAVIFAEWLIATFGREALNRGSGVLDVAGGSGSLSFELQTVRGIRCTLIDPRPQKLSKVQRRWLHQHAKASQLHQQPKIDCAVSSLDSAQSQHAATPALNFQPAERILKSLRRPTTHAEASPTEGTACASRPAFVSTDPSLDDKILQQSWRSSNSTCSSEAATSGFLFHSPAETSQGRASSSANPSSNSRWPAVTAVDGPPRVPPGLQQPPSLLPAANSGCKPSDAPCDLENTSPQVFNKSPRWGASVGVTPIGQPAEEPDIEGLVPEPGLEGQLSRQIQAEFTERLWTEGEAADCLQDCSLVVGLHPDQATDSIVDFALQHSKSFAVVPCCVFPRLFADRQLLDSMGLAQPVISYNDLIVHLRQKSKASAGYLAFEGMNQVLFRCRCD